VIFTGSVVRRLRVHNVQRRGDIITLTFTSKDNVTLVVGATVRVDDLSVGSVDNGHWSGLEGSVADLLSIGQSDLLDDRGLVQTSARSRSTGVLNEEDLITGGVPRVPVRLMFLRVWMY
jgi:hypothetical protein